MVFWNQLEGNNIVVSGLDRSGRARAPTYNFKLGFSNGKLSSRPSFPFLFSLPIHLCADIMAMISAGAQTDIFLEDGSATRTFIEPSPSITPQAEPEDGDDRNTSHGFSSIAQPLGLGVAVGVIVLVLCG
jgi:hypothetical protein